MRWYSTALEGKLGGNPRGGRINGNAATIAFPTKRDGIVGLFFWGTPPELRRARVELLKRQLPRSAVASLCARSS
jgi:hypothetical protein